MDRYDRIIRDIQQKTRTAVLKWRVVNPSDFDHLLMNRRRVVRAYMTRYELKKAGYDLLFVEKKLPNPFDLDRPLERLECELFVLDQDGQIIMAFFDGVVDRADLLDLDTLIREYNDQAKDFFEAFDEADVT